MTIFLSLALAFFSLGVMAATAADLRIINATRIDRGHFYAVPDSHSEDGPDHLEG